MFLNAVFTALLQLFFSCFQFIHVNSSLNNIFRIYLCVTKYSANTSLISLSKQSKQIEDVQEQIAKFQVNLNREQAKLNKMPQTKNIKIQIENKFIHNDYGYFRKDLLVSE